MLVGIHFDPLHQFSEYLLKYEKILQFNQIDTIRLSSNSSDFWEIVPKLDLFIFQYGQWDIAKQNAEAILPIIENEYKISCFPDQRTSWAYDNKIKEFYLMRSNNLPMVQSWVFWEKEAAMEWATSAELPVVFKLSGGAGSKNVILLKTQNSLIKIIDKMFDKGILDNSRFGRDSLNKKLIEKLIRKMSISKRKLLNEPIPFRHLKPNWIRHKDYVYFQKFLPGNQFDTRVVIIGDKAFAFRRMNRKNDFRSSGSGVNDVSPDKIDLNHVKKAFQVSKTMGFQSMAYDYLYNNMGESVFCEFSYTFPDKTVSTCPGYWDENLKWHSGSYWPQYLQLKLLLNEDLKQPENL
ncbi:hypothetical protein AYK24_03275 [Thermoplasmatales archaeon SG8-52-4]|nr:MAG: hypothetical protein AYK24_03275 [Thermoplasmatales archaeon SG8-52-4]